MNSINLEEIKKNHLSSISYREEVSLDIISHRYNTIIKNYIKKESFFSKISIFFLISSVSLSIILIYLYSKGFNIVYHPLTLWLSISFFILCISVFTVHIYQIKPIYLKDTENKPIKEFWFLYHNLNFLNEKQKNAWTLKYYQELNKDFDFAFTNTVLNWGYNSLKNFNY